MPKKKKKQDDKEDKKPKKKKETPNPSMSITFNIINPNDNLKDRNN